LLNRILSEPHGKKYAVIVNEFGEIGIDNELIVGADEEVFEMNNGCICCTVRGDLILIIDGLMRRKGKFDAIIAQIRKQKVAAVFLENVTDPRLVEQIARETGAKVGGTLYSDALTDDKGDATTYIDLIRHNLRQLASALVS